MLEQSEVKVMRLGGVLENRITGRYRRVCGWALGEVVLREVREDGRLGDGAIHLPGWLVALLYRERTDLVAPWEGTIRTREG
jgi:hypothetical protein